jgi:hypothetical protein
VSDLVILRTTTYWELRGQSSNYEVARTNWTGTNTGGIIYTVGQERSGGLYRCYRAVLKFNLAGLDLTRILAIHLSDEVYTYAVSTGRDWSLLLVDVPDPPGNDAAMYAGLLTWPVNEVFGSKARVSAAYGGGALVSDAMNLACLANVNPDAPYLYVGVILDQDRNGNAPGANQAEWAVLQSNTGNPNYLPSLLIDYGDAPTEPPAGVAGAVQERGRGWLTRVRPVRSLDDAERALDDIQQHSRRQINFRGVFASPEAVSQMSPAPGPLDAWIEATSGALYIQMQTATPGRTTGSRRRLKVSGTIENA